jgi:hypothetical protein
MFDSNLYVNINNLNSEEIIEKIKIGYFNEEAQKVAEKILTERNISIPIFDENYSSPKIPFYKSHPIWFWTFFGAGVTVLTRLIQKIANSF